MMEELAFSREQMQRRAARFSELDVIEAQKGDMPVEVRDIIYSRKLMPVITLAESDTGGTPFGRSAPILGAGGMTMTYAVCPPGTGPSLHRHLQTFETFTVMQGRFEFSWGEDGANTIVLGEFDVISIPPGISRAFRNVSDAEGILQVIITGGVHDMDDIEFPASTARQIERHGKRYLEEFEARGLRFGARE